MHVLAQYAPALILVASGAGALVLCLLIYLYGFSPAADDGPRTAIRRLLVTRVGLALAAVCFAVTAVAAVFGPWQRPSSPALAPAPVPAQTTAPSAAIRAEALKLRGAVDALDARLRALETSLREVGADARKTSARVERLERAKPQVAQPAPRAPAPQAAAPALVTPRERAAARGEVPPARSVGTTRRETLPMPSDVPARRSEPPSPRAESPMTRTEEWPPPPQPEPLGLPTRFSPAPEPRPATRAEPAAPRALPNANHALPPPERARRATRDRGEELREGLRQLGGEIREAFAAAGDRIRKALGRD